MIEFAWLTNEKRLKSHLERSELRHKLASMDELFLSTDMVDPDMRTGASQTTRLFFDTTHRPGHEDQPLEGSLRSRLVGGMLIGPTSFNDQQYCRDQRTIVASGLDQYLIQLFVEGSLEGDCAGTAIRVEQGDICVFDLAQPLTTRVSRGSTISVILARDAVDRLSGGRNLHGTVLSADDPSTRLVADVIRSVSGLAPGTAGDHRFTAMAEPVAGLIISGLIQGRRRASRAGIVAHGSAAPENARLRRTASHLAGDRTDRPDEAIQYLPSASLSHVRGGRRRRADHPGRSAGTDLTATLWARLWPSARFLTSPIFTALRAADSSIDPFARASASRRAMSRRKASRPSCRTSGWQRYTRSSLSMPDKWRR